MDSEKIASVPAAVYAIPDSKDRDTVIDSFATKCAAFWLCILFCLLVQVNSAGAFERIQFDPDRDRKTQTATQPALPATQPAINATEKVTPGKENPAEERVAPLLPPAPPIVAPVDRLPASVPVQRPVLKPAFHPALQTAAGPALRSAPGPAQQPAPRSASGQNSIRIALNPSANKAEIVVPDGAQIIEEGSQRLLAELPARSRWLFAIENGVSGKRFTVSRQTNGQSSGAGALRLLLAPDIVGSDLPAGKKRPRASSAAADSDSLQPVDSASPKFCLPAGSAGRTAVPPSVVNGYMIQPSQPGAALSCDGRTYRGAIVLKPRSGESPSFLVVNLIDIEDYLLSVVPSEMPCNWGLEALKAQSIAGRSYAIANLGKHASEGYDLKASSEDQDYRGVQSEAPASSRAVAETRGLVLTHHGKVVTAYFHSAGGGFTEICENVYGGKVPYLKSVPDFDAGSPHSSWNRNIPVALIEENLRKQGREIGGLLGIFPLEYSLSQRVTSAMLAGTLQTILLSGEELRKLLGLPSTVFNINPGPDAYLVSGRGFGHGLGMSQWGAKHLSEQGYNAAQILSYYYKDVTVDQF
jgi:stage II sporulation protein D